MKQIQLPFCSLFCYKKQIPMPFLLLNLLVDSFFQRKARQPFWLTRFLANLVVYFGIWSRFRCLFAVYFAIWNKFSYHSVPYSIIRNRFRCFFCSWTCWLTHFFNDKRVNRFGWRAFWQILLYIFAYEADSDVFLLFILLYEADSATILLVIML